MFSAVLHQKQNIVFLSHQRQLFSSAEGTYPSLSAHMGTCSSLVHCPSSPFGEATCSSLHLQYCAFQSQVKAVNLGRLFDSQKETLVLPKSQTSEGSGSICFQILRAQRDALSKSHFLLTPQRLESSKAPPKRNMRLHSLMWFESCDTISHCDSQYLKAWVWSSANTANHFYIRSIF